ncbi:Hydantoinase/oxoprolinase [Neolentinus lepideus HHB14362 ss-1]|uniref:Hydantoinase/oxoprolinase n=1 Tax=Neolentinus lepideus HHB14362 ss-1 TaxID=1314782 RepID=A0A165SH79_9AGAM|nr:Hydantoinase/oxoprolinase [Neolentinus lepideus HHB14362 ss-1]
MTTTQHYRIGVDVGGTNTDGILLSLSPSSSSQANRGVLASFKSPTTPDVTSGIENAVRAVLEQSGVAPREVGSLMIGTTHFINAVVEHDARRLSKVAVIRLGAPYTDECPPFLDFPPPLRAIMDGHVAILKGGLHIDGKPINDIDEAEIISECKIIKEKNIKAIAIVGIFSSLDRQDGLSQEDRARMIIERELGKDIHVVCSREVANQGLLERENASILNASILAFARRTIASFRRAMGRVGLSCPLFLTQNDGTLTTAREAARLPIRTFASGQTNSMRGASYLAGLGSSASEISKKSGSIIVVDVGGTTTDVGVLLPSGFPRQAAAFISVGGVRTNFSMPDVQSIGLGGGSIVSLARLCDHMGLLIVHCSSTGYKLLTEGLVFGGSTRTATDVAVALDPSLDIGDVEKVKSAFSEDELVGAKECIKKLLEDVIDRMKTSPEPATVLLVGGGSVIAPEELNGVAELIRPPLFSCANAVGACVANVSGEVDTIEILEDRKLEDVVEKVKALAVERAVKNGAKKQTVKVVEVENLPVQYVTIKATRLVVRAVGELDIEAVPAGSTVVENVEDSDEAYQEGEKESANGDAGFVEEKIDIAAYRPTINEQGEWILSEIDLEWIQEGCGILGTGGGGSPYPPFIMARQVLREGGCIKVISHASLADDALIFRGHFMGSPSVSNERLQGGAEVETACRNLMKFLSVGKPAAVISDEIGGGNGIQPMILASEKHLNFDGDLMGRAYPQMWCSLPAAFSVPASLTPCAIADGVNNSIVLPSTSNKYMVETILRGVCTTLGSKAGVSMAPLTAKTCREYGVTRTVSQAWRLGRAVAQCRAKSNLGGIPNAILGLQNGKCLFVGKIVGIEREWGSVIMAPLASEEEESKASEKSPEELAIKDATLRIEFQNENLRADLTTSDGKKELIAVVPDLITVLDSQSGSALGTHEYRYGLRVTVIGLAGHPLWSTKEGLKTGGPAAFGLDLPFRPVGVYREPVGVIEEYGPGSRN